MKTTVTNISVDDEQVREAWVELLSSYDYDEFVTATFNLPQRDPDRARSMFTAWLRRRYFKHAKSVGDVREETLTKRDGYGRVVGKRTRYKGAFANAWRRGQLHPIWCLGIEKHKDGTNHMHAAVKHQVFAKTIRRDAGWHEWFSDMDLGRIRLEPPESQEDVRGYMSKYVCKGGEIDLSPSFARTLKSLTV